VVTRQRRPRLGRRSATGRRPAGPSSAVRESRDVRLVAARERSGLEGLVLLMLGAHRSTLYQRMFMRILKPCLLLLAVVVAGALVGCSTTAKSPDVSAGVRTALDQAGLKDVSVSQDREKGVVTLGGHVATDADKAQAESVARSLVGTQVVANQIAVILVGAENASRDINSDLDKGIESNLDAALISARLHRSVKYAVKNRVVTLTGEVNSPANRARAEQVAGAVPNVEQVVNTLQVKDQKATSGN